MMHKKSELRSYQNRLVTTLYESNGHLVVVPMGGGKTISGLTAVDELITAGEIRHALVLAPKRVAQLVWPDEVGLWEHTQHMKFKLLNGDPKRRSADIITAPDRHLTIVGIDNTQWLCGELERLPDDHPLFDVLIIDEISRFRNPKSKRAKALITQVHRFKNIWGLTGTPRPNGLEDLFKPLQIISREKLWGRSFYSWRDQRFYPTDYERRNWSIRPDWEERTNREAATLTSTMSPTDMPGLPELNIVEHFVDLPPDAQEAYDDMEKTLFAELEDQDVLAASAGVASGKLSQMAQGFAYGNDEDRKVTTIHTAKREWIEDLVESLAGDPAILVYEFHQDLAVLQELFGKDLPYLGQGVTDATAKKHVDNWNAKKLPLFAIHPASGGHGLNLGQGGSQMIFYGLPWSAELYDQVVHRIHRPGQTQPCFIHICLARDTIDEAKRFRVLHKMDMQEAFKKYLRKI
jgi:SNF2 family DNA or RNA helicase